MLRSPTAALLILTLINLFNYIDRYVLPPILERLKDKKDGLGLTDLEAGMLAFSFVIVYAIASPLFGRLGDRGSRKGLIALGVGIWSLATAAGGLTRSFLQIFGARGAVGIGEAAYGTISPALLADYFPPAKRGRMYAIFFSAIPVGSALGFVLGGLIASRFGWRAAFFIAGLPGLLLAALALLLREPARGAQDGPSAPGADATLGHGAAHAPAGMSVGEAYRTLLRIRPYALTVYGYAAYTFAVGGLAYWMPAFLERSRGVPREDASVVFGGITVVTGFIGTLAGGWLGDRFLARGTRNAYLLVSGIATVIAVPFALAGVLVTDLHLLYGAIFVAELFLFASTSPINAAVVNLAPIELRATASALCILLIHVLGDAISPPIIGGLSLVLGDNARSLAIAVLIVPVAIAVAAAIWTKAALEGGREAPVIAAPAARP